jgi:hypothetical protein
MRRWARSRERERQKKAAELCAPTSATVAVPRGKLHAEAPLGFFVALQDLDSGIEHVTLRIVKQKVT